MAGLDSTLHSKLLLAGYSDRNRRRRSRPPRREPNPRLAWSRSPDHGLPRRRRPIGALFSGPDHGSSAFHPVCAGNARSAIIVFHSGELRRIEKGKDDLFDAAATGVGAIGIVTEVKWACEEAFGLEVTMEPCRLEDYLDEQDSGEKLWELARSSEYVKVRRAFCILFLAAPVLERLKLTRNSLVMQLWYYPSPTWSIKFAQYGPLASASPPSPSPSTRETALSPSSSPI